MCDGVKPKWAHAFFLALLFEDGVKHFAARIIMRSTLERISAHCIAVKKQDVSVPLPLRTPCVHSKQEGQALATFVSHWCCHGLSPGPKKHVPIPALPLPPIHLYPHNAIHLSAGLAGGDWISGCPEIHLSPQLAIHLFPTRVSGVLLSGCLHIHLSPHRTIHVFPNLAGGCLVFFKFFSLPT